MRLIDKIALNRVLRVITDFIIRLVEILNKQKESDIKPSPSRPKPIKKIVDRILPWRNK